MANGIIPADAGSTALLRRSEWSHQGSSPRMRGAQYTQLSIRGAAGIIPADAGSTALVS